MNARMIARAIGMAAVLACTAGLQAAITIDTVPVGNPGNAGELSGESHGGDGADKVCGAVDYVYEMGEFEVTAGQYCDFLNAVAKTDTYGLHNSNMEDSNVWGCRITQNGSSGSYTYDFSAGIAEVPDSTASDWANRPVNYVSWGDAARFANWLHNDQPTGAQDMTTTEDGSYFLNGAMTNDELAMVREPDATWVIPSEDEWYKAAYHKNDGVTGNYFDYPTSNDSLPSNDLVDPDPGNNATYHIASDYTIGDPYYRTEMGDHEHSESPYGTFDQGGNVWEWNEALITSEPWPYRGVRGGSFLHEGKWLGAASHGSVSPDDENTDYGFRVALVPEPATMAILVLGGVALLRRRRT